MKQEIKLNLKEALKGQAPITNSKILGYIKECIHTLESLGYEISDTIDFKEASGFTTFGVFSWPDDPNKHSAITLNVHMYNEDPAAIKNTIYHELCHYLTFKHGLKVNAYTYHSLRGVWIKGPSYHSYGKNGWTAHGEVWKSYAQKIGRAVNQDITRAGDYKLHTGVGAKYNSAIKYIVTCKACNGESTFIKRTAFVKEPNITQYDYFLKTKGIQAIRRLSPDRIEKYKQTPAWKCGHCGASGRFETKEVNKDETD